MITILKRAEHGLETIQEIVPGCWINVVDPGPDEIARLQANVDAPADFVTYPLDLDERARTEKDNGATLIILRVPHFQGAAADVPYTTVPLGIILTDKLIVTVCKAENGIMRDLIGGRVKNLSTAKRNRFVLYLLLGTANAYLSDLREINKAVDALEDRLQHAQRNEQLMALLKVQKSLVYFTTALKSNELVLQRLQRSRLFEMYPEDEDLLEDALTETQQAIEMTNISSSILSQMMDAFASIISNNLNVVMKFLASITILLSIPTIVTGLYGMNVSLPGQDAGYAFLMVLGIAFGISLIIAVIFWKRDWF
ncbi:MAG TPA: magnesium transporter CorA family protein [Anaerolineae bacterium]|nr:magnesium transporter CorA family protein [Anaerolineae bacterium]